MKFNFEGLYGCDPIWKFAMMKYNYESLQCCSLILITCSDIAKF